ncbi:oxalate decarboxylase/phosphoglucose isomerase-like protein (cupin superfamily) [Sinorhizobium meliloti]
MAKEEYFLYPTDVDSFGFDWGRLALTVAPEVNGAERFSGGVVDLPSGEGHTRHNHPGAEEIIFVVSGEGEQMVEDENGDPVTQRVGPGCTIYVPESRIPLDEEHGSRPDAAFRGLFTGRP